MPRPSDPPARQRRFYIDAGTVMLAARPDGRNVTRRVATPEDLACLNWFGRRVLDTAQGYWDVASFHWMANRTLKRPAQREARG